MEEIWKDVDGFEGRYQISNFGNVKSLNYNNTGNPKNLVKRKNYSGYLWVNLHLYGTHKPKLVHRLVAEAFIPNPNQYSQINHKDENKGNNEVSNLEWCTQSYNAKYYLERHPGALNERLEKARASRKPRSPKPPKILKIKSTPKTSRFNQTIIQTTKDGEFVKEWENSNTIKHTTGWNASSIIRCCEGARKTAYGFKWHFAV